MKPSTDASSSDLFHGEGAGLRGLHKPSWVLFVWFCHGAENATKPTGDTADSNNGNDNKKFDKGETFSMGFFLFYEELMS